MSLIFLGITFDIGLNITSINGYTPRNKKLLQYPFCYIGFNPPNGSNKIYRYEDCTAFPNTQNIRFKMYSEINPNPTVYFIPYGYKYSSGYNPLEGVTLSGYPNISYSTDYFSGWLAQNQSLLKIERERQDLNYDTSMSKNVLNYASQTASNVNSIISGNIVGGLTNFATSSGNTLLNAYSLSKNYDLDIRQMRAQIEKQQMLPNFGTLGGGSNATLIGMSQLKNSIFTRIGIKPEFSERIDEYFDMFGYKTNKLKIPNLNNRPNWNYVKTIGIIIESKQSTSTVDNTVIQEDMQELKNLFDNGITLWHNPSTFLDYSQNNR